jgi:hypothetical protein
MKGNIIVNSPSLVFFVDVEIESFRQKVGMFSKHLFQAMKGKM